MISNTSTFLDHLQTQRAHYRYRLPSRPDAGRFIDQLMRLLFPVTQDCKSVSQHVEETYQSLHEQLTNLLCPLEKNLSESPAVITERFFEKLPAIYDSLLLDAHSIADNDPAAIGVEEVVAVYPGFYAIAVYRISHELLQQNVPCCPEC